jgi:hypothetical protein
MLPVVLLKKQSLKLLLLRQSLLERRHEGILATGNRKLQNIKGETVS